MTTGRAFFDEIENPRDRIIAHMRRDPFEDPERLRSYPAAIAKLLRAATARSRRSPVAARVRPGVRGRAVDFAANRKQTAELRSATASRGAVDLPILHAQPL